MPFTITDVDKHKKGLSDKAKEQWIAIANSVLERCEKAGGEMCDATAIKQASGAVEKGMTYNEAIRQFVLKDRQTFNIAGVEIFSTGKWNDDDYTEIDLDNMITAFDNVGFKPPLKLGHDNKGNDGQPAIGWIDKIYRAGNKLLADFKELPLKVYDAIKRGNYKQVSSEIYRNHNNNGKIFGRVLKAVALLGADIPAVTNLEGLENLYSNNEEVKIYNMEREFEEWDTNLRNVLAKLKQADLTAEQRQQALRHLQNYAKASGIGEFVEMINLENKTNGGVKEMEDLNKANEKIVELEAQVKGLSADKEAVDKAFAEIRQKEKALSIRTFIEEQKKAGKIIPAFEKEIESLFISANDEKIYKYSYEGKEIELTQKETLERLISNLPKMVDFTELSKNIEGVTTGEYKNAGDEVDKLTKAYSEKNEVSYSDSLKIVLDKNPELKSEYLKGGK